MINNNNRFGNLHHDASVRCNPYVLMLIRGAWHFPRSHSAALFNCSASREQLVVIYDVPGTGFTPLLPSGLAVSVVFKVEVKCSGCFQPSPLQHKHTRRRESDPRCNMPLEKCNVDFVFVSLHSRILVLDQG